MPLALVVCPVDEIDDLVVVVRRSRVSRLVDPATGRPYRVTTVIAGAKSGRRQDLSICMVRGEDLTPVFDDPEVVVVMEVLGRQWADASLRDAGHNPAQARALLSALEDRGIDTTGLDDSSPVGSVASRVTDLLGANLDVTKIWV